MLINKFFIKVLFIFVKNFKVFRIDKEDVFILCCIFNMLVIILSFVNFVLFIVIVLVLNIKLWVVLLVFCCVV